MNQEQTSPLLKKWKTFTSLPFGRWVFGQAIGFLVPYTGTIGPRVEELRYGYARASFRDRRKVRNHLKSVHAIAMINLAEMVCSLAISTIQPKDGRWIVRGMDIEYIKKGRGRITAECTPPDVDWTKEMDLTGEVLLKDPAGDTVAIAHTRWKTGPVK
ncbi:MAG: DUF4442 domain-containing protein [Rhodospirillales bacterium]|nr:DUF4442 domain-containing protein [Rhodospirillales bacterium]